MSVDRYDQPMPGRRAGDIEHGSIVDRIRPVAAPRLAARQA
jgi:hypothetical protein